jgi:hypothetical protein
MSAGTPDGELKVAPGSCVDDDDGSWVVAAEVGWFTGGAAVGVLLLHAVNIVKSMIRAAMI